MWIIGGSHWRLADDGSCRNTAFLAEPDGRLHTQDKLHLTPPEKAIGGVGGERVMIASIGSVRVAILICADLEFPELTRHLVMHGVELVARTTSPDLEPARGANLDPLFEPSLGHREPDVRGDGADDREQRDPARWRAALQGAGRSWPARS